MLGHEHFYWKLIKKYTAVFGTMFNEIYIPRYDSEGVQDALIKVPITNANKDQFIARITNDPNLGKPNALTLPRIAFELVNFRPAPERQLNSTNRLTYTDDTGATSQQYVPIPFDFNFQLSIYGNAYEDVSKILEQIVVFFPPEHNIEVELIPEMNVTVNIPIEMEGAVTIEDHNKLDKGQPRKVIATLNFVLYGMMFGPVKTSSLIKFIDVKFLIPQGNATLAETNTDNTDAIDQITIQPGLTANGTPTTNVAESVSYLTINLNDDWDYITNIAGQFEQEE